LLNDAIWSHVNIYVSIANFAIEKKNRTILYYHVLYIPKSGVNNIK